jgi:hypothetical protein
MSALWVECCTGKVRFCTQVPGWAAKNICAWCPICMYVRAAGWEALTVRGQTEIAAGVLPVARNFGFRDYYSEMHYRAEKSGERN